MMAEGKHPFPYRTRQLSPPAPMVLRFTRGRVGRCQELIIFWVNMLVPGIILK